MAQQYKKQQSPQQVRIGKLRAAVSILLTETAEDKCMTLTIFKKYAVNIRYDEEQMNAEMEKSAQRALASSRASSRLSKPSNSWK